MVQQYHWAMFYIANIAIIEAMSTNGSHAMRTIPKRYITKLRLFIFNMEQSLLSGTAFRFMTMSCRMRGVNIMT